VATGITLYKAETTALTATDGTKVGTSANFTVAGAAPNSMAFINCTQPSNPNPTCSGAQPFSTGNNGTLQANIGLKDAYGNVASATAAVSITLTSSSTPNYTVSPSPVTVAVGGGQTNQFTVTPAQSNPATTTFTAHVTSGGSWSNITLTVSK
jgi:hypothetical protein